MPTKPNYVLKAGVVVHPNGTNQFYANANIPDEVAEQRLAEHPETISDFLSYPIDWKARVEARKNVEESAPTELESVQAAYKDAVERGNKALAELAAKKEELESANAALAATENELASVKEQLAAQSAAAPDDDGSLSIENETLKADLEVAQAEIETLKQQLEEAKAATAPTTKKRASKTAAE